METYIDASLLLGYENMGPLQHLILDLMRNARGICATASVDACHSKIENLQLKATIYDTLPSNADVVFSLNILPQNLPNGTRVVVCAPEPTNKVYAAKQSSLLAILTDTLPEELAEHAPGHIRILWNNYALTPLNIFNFNNLPIPTQTADAICFVYDSRELFKEERPFKQVWDSVIDTTHYSLVHLLPTLQKNKHFILLDISHEQNWRNILENVRPKLYWNAVNSPSVAVYIHRLAEHMRTHFLDWHNRTLSPMRYFLQNLTPEVSQKNIYSVSEKFKRAFNIFKMPVSVPSSSALNNASRTCTAQDVLTALQQRLDGAKNICTTQTPIIFTDSRDAVAIEENFIPMEGVTHDAYTDVIFRVRWHEVMRLLPQNGEYFRNMLERAAAASVQCYVDEVWIAQQQNNIAEWPQWLATCERVIEQLYAKNPHLKDAYSGLAAIKRTDPHHVNYYLDLEAKRQRTGNQYYVEQTIAHAVANHQDYEKTLQMAIRTHRAPQIARSLIAKILFDLGQTQRALDLFEKDCVEGKMIASTQLDYFVCLMRAGRAETSDMLLQKTWAHRLL